MITKIDHIGIAVQSLEEAVPLYEKSLGLPCAGREEIASQQVRTAFFRAGETMIELLEPMSPESPIAKFMAKSGEGIHHIALGTSDVRAQLAQAKETGIRLINEQPVQGAHGKQIAFLHPKSTRGVLMELCSTAAEARGAAH